MIIKKILTGSVISLITLPAFTQFCTPKTTNYCCGFGITQVDFASINNPSSDASVGYEDFTSVQTNLTAGNSYSISIDTKKPSEHNIRVWIDYNNDGTFGATSELVFSATKVFVGTGNISIPLNATQNTALRMRISADFYQNSPPTPCADLVSGQAEDYTVIILPNTNPPTASYAVNDSVSCSGTVIFSDKSLNVPTKWSWNFGDNSFSNLPNPTHTYTASGKYTVTLIATNNFGSDTLKKTNFIHVTLENALKTPTCTPTTSSHCCGNGVYKVVFNTINNSTAGGEDNYQDYSCTNNTIVEETKTYPITINTGATNPEDVKVWCDLNDNGVFETPTELIFSSNNKTIHSGNITIPTGSVQNKPIRMRIMCDQAGKTLDPCTNVLFGQTEDYGITIIPKFVKPITAFTVDTQQTCSGIISFTDLTTNNPTSWLWKFGDNTTSTTKNPVHTYAQEGTYNVTLVTTNPAGKDSLTKTNYIIFDSSLCVTAVTEILQHSIEIYPNPTSTNLYVKNMPTNAIVDLYNTLGKKYHPELFYSSKSEIGIDISSFENGIYFMTISDNSSLLETKKIIVNKHE